MECIGEIDLSVGGVWRLGSGVAGGGVLRRVFGWFVGDLGLRWRQTSVAREGEGWCGGGGVGIG